MKTFLWTTVFRLIVLLGSRIYVSNYQTDSLYNFLNMNNPATKAVTDCYSGVVNMWSGIDMKLDAILSKLSGDIATNTGTTITTSGSSFNDIVFTSTGSTKVTVGTKN